MVRAFINVTSGTFPPAVCCVPPAIMLAFSGGAYVVAFESFHCEPEKDLFSGWTVKASFDRSSLGEVLDCRVSSAMVIILNPLGGRGQSESMMVCEVFRGGGRCGAMSKQKLNLGESRLIASSFFQARQSFDYTYTEGQLRTNNTPQPIHYRHYRPRDSTTNHENRDDCLNDINKQAIGAHNLSHDASPPQRRQITLRRQ